MKMSGFRALFGSPISYHQLNSSTSLRDIEGNAQEDKTTKAYKSIWRSTCLYITLFSLLLTPILLLVLVKVDQAKTSFALPITHHSLTVRREWRSLDAIEKSEYIAAVQCLRTRPSKIGLNQSLYDDFPWVHSQVGEYSHESAAFLSWHRYFIQIYERTLQRDCGYQGQLPYWDWTLDWQDITQSPVWDSSLGFGGTGDPNAGQSILSGHCVVDGPFANLEVLYLKGRTSKHCLSRGFLASNSTELRSLSQWIRPSKIEDLLREDDYEPFNLGLEESAHIAIPRTIRGDFSLFTAPYDPVFFLHHAQLDRLWDKWQQRESCRTQKYTGTAARNTTTRATLQDKLPMGGLAPDVSVSSIMDITKGILLYTY